MSINSFFQRIVPKDKRFFPMFEELAGFAYKAASVLVNVFERDDPVKHKDLLKQIKDFEMLADAHVQAIFEELDKSFITPFDREDIHELTSLMDSVIDLINGVAQRIRYYRPINIPPVFTEFSQLILSGCEQMKLAVSDLRNLGKQNKILKICQKMSNIETKADDLYHSTISGIFKKEKDAIELIKQKEILETMERATDRIEDVSDVLKTILLKMA